MGKKIKPKLNELTVLYDEWKDKQNRTSDSIYDLYSFVINILFIPDIKLNNEFWFQIIDELCRRQIRYN